MHNFNILIHLYPWGVQLWHTFAYFMANKYFFSFFSRIFKNMQSKQTLWKKATSLPNIQIHTHTHTLDTFDDVVLFYSCIKMSSRQNHHRLQDLVWLCACNEVWNWKSDPCCMLNYYEICPLFSIQFSTFKWMPMALSELYVMVQHGVYLIHTNGNLNR